LKNHTAGLIPAGQLSIEVETERAMQELRRKGRPIEKYIFMQTMQDTNETLYYRMLVEHTAELLPIVYTPVVGQVSTNPRRFLHSSFILLLASQWLPGEFSDISYWFTSINRHAKNFISFIARPYVESICL
jgi:hypothetical protein